MIHSLPPTIFPPRFLSSPTATALLASLCSLFAFAQMAGAAEQGQGGRQKEREFNKKKKKKLSLYSKTMPWNRYTQLMQQAITHNEQSGWEGDKYLSPISHIGFLNKSWIHYVNNYNQSQLWGESHFIWIVVSEQATCGSHFCLSVKLCSSPQRS